MKKIVSFILAVTICTSILGAEFKEITPLEYRYYVKEKDGKL